MCTNVSRALLVLVFMAASALSQEMVDAQVPVKVNVAANVKIEPPASIGGQGDEGTVTANVSKNFNIKLVEKPGPLSCALANANTTGKVGEEIPKSAFNVLCEGSPTNVGASTNTVWSSLTPTSEGTFTITVRRNSNASSCKDETATCTIQVPGSSGSTALHLRNSVNAGVAFNYSRGNITLGLNSQFYQNAVISLHSIKGNQVLRSTNMSSSVNLPAGVYLLSVKGAKGNLFAKRLTHSGNTLNIKASFGDFGYSQSISNVALAKPGDYGDWSIVVSAVGYSTQRRSFSPDAGLNPEEVFEMKEFQTPEKKSFTETVNNVSFDMVYIPGGTFTIGCEKDSGCPSDTKPVSGVKVSNYFIGKTEVTTGLYNAVMGTTCSGYMCQTNSPNTNINWYGAMEFACRLSELTGKNYRMTTEAEWEYAAKNHISNLDRIGSGEEWAYNTWNGTHMGGIDPLGPGSGTHNQKTRRDAQGTADNITGRLIRSIEGMGPALRLSLSADVELPPGYVHPCDIHAPEMGEEPENSYRDPRWITGDNARWKTSGDIAIGNFDLRVWEDGTATMKGYNDRFQLVDIAGQWFSSNNITFVFVPNSGNVKRYAYIFVDENHGSTISDKGYMDGYVGRIEKVPADPVTKPTISGLLSGEALAKAQPDFATYYKMVDMVNPPKNEQDARLIEGPGIGWFQDNSSNGGVHHYRKDVDADEFRFTVNQSGGRTMLANGTWFTINNTFLRVTHSTGYSVDYLYAYVPASGSGNSAQAETFYHNSFMAYERADFRMFQKRDNSASFPCGGCNEEIPKGAAVSMYRNRDDGHSTFTPAPCPAGGCK